MREEGDNPAPAEDSEAQIGGTAYDNQQKPELMSSLLVAVPKSVLVSIAAYENLERGLC